VIAREARQSKEPLRLLDCFGAVAPVFGQESAGRAQQNAPHRSSQRRKSASLRHSRISLSA
jgi:hypothetical protein